MMTSYTRIYPHSLNHWRYYLCGCILLGGAWLVKVYIDISDELLADDAIVAVTSQVQADYSLQLPPSQSSIVIQLRELRMHNIARVTKTTALNDTHVDLTDESKTALHDEITAWREAYRRLQ